ncbi:MAG TPA: DUF711 family protein [Jiangellaceae bacterium]
METPRLGRREVIRDSVVVGGAVALAGSLAAPGLARAAERTIDIPTENKIVRTITYFTDAPSDATIERLNGLSERLQAKGYTVQTIRVCSKSTDIDRLTAQLGDSAAALCVGKLSYLSARRQLKAFFAAPNTSFQIDLTDATIGLEHVDFFRRIAAERPGHTFNFAYVFNNPQGSPFFPAAAYAREGFAVGLQPTNLSVGATSVEEWLAAMRQCWTEIVREFHRDRDFLGIDGPTAPFGAGAGSLIGFVKRLGFAFERSTTTSTYVTTTEFLRNHNPQPVGLNGLMLPCLEDSELTAEYDAGRFSVERNLFLSLHSGLGIDTYPVGVDEDPARMLEILRLTQALSNKHRKALSVRFATDGVAAIGDRTNFQSQYLTDCTVRPL